VGCVIKDTLVNLQTIVSPSTSNLYFATDTLDLYRSDGTSLQIIDSGGGSTVEIAYIKDIKPSGTNGGTFTGGATWQTRDLNTVEGDTAIVSLSLNQFTLGSGKYIIDSSSPARSVNNHKAKIRNITDSTDTIIGQSAYSDSASATTKDAIVGGVITLVSSKTYELQHRSASTQSNTGFGQPSSMGVDEVYSHVKITKIG
jgi:hypothetical protein